MRRGSGERSACFLFGAVMAVPVEEAVAALATFSLEVCSCCHRVELDLFLDFSFFCLNAGISFAEFYFFSFCSVCAVVGGLDGACLHCELGEFSFNDREEM